jgi:uncharacterized membrane protein YphA (DoxX/SURF4 family)
MATARPAPRPLEALLGFRGTALLARTALVSAYLIGGVVKATDFGAAVAEQRHFGLEPAWLWATLAIVVEIGGAALVISGRLVWLGAGALGVLTAVAMVVANDFWTMAGPARTAAFNAFFEHAGLIGGLALAAVLAQLRAPSRDHP